LLNRKSYLGNISKGNMHSMAPDRILKWGEGAHVRRKTPDNFFVVPFTFLPLRVQLVVWWTLLRCSAQFCPSLVCCSSTHGLHCAQLYEN